MNEILAGIKVLKLYAWEIPFIKKILQIRKEESNTIKKVGFIQAFQNFNFVCSPMLISLFTFT